MAEARASDPPRDDRPQDLNIRHIRENLVAQSGNALSFSIGAPSFTVSNLMHTDC